MEKALKQLNYADYAIFDGNRQPYIDWLDTDYLVKADFYIECVSAASILAKVFRDQLISKQSIQYPQYGFEQHKGYGTKQHIQALKEHGPSPIHRMSYKPVKNAVR